MSLPCEKESRGSDKGHTCRNPLSNDAIPAGRIETPTFVCGCGVTSKSVAFSSSGIHSGKTKRDQNGNLRPEALQNTTRLCFERSTRHHCYVGSEMPDEENTCRNVSEILFTFKWRQKWTKNVSCFAQGKNGNSCNWRERKWKSKRQRNCRLGVTFHANSIGECEINKTEAQMSKEDITPEAVDCHSSHNLFPPKLP